MSDDFNIFDISEEPQKQELPDWPVFKDPEKKEISVQIYNAICDKRDQIIVKLNGGIELKGKEKKIIQADISNSVGKNISYLNNREFPSLVDFISFTNGQLKLKKTVGSTTKQQPKIDPKARVDELESLILNNQLEELINNRVIGQLGALKQQNIKLADENDRLSTELSECRQSVSSLMREVSDQLSKVDKLEKEIRRLGGNPKNKANLVPVKK